MDLVRQFVDLFLHLDKHLAEVMQEYGLWTYLILVVVVFCETGLVVTPILPGDSLLFAAGALAALDKSPLSPFWLTVLLIVAAVLGDSVNYAIGKRIGPRVFERDYRFLNRRHLERTRAFYEKHGGKTIVLARFVPIVRTFAPFVAGVGTMNYPRFLMFNVVGGVVWVALFVWAGYLFGNVPVVKENFGLVVVAIVILSVLPMVVEMWRAWREARAGQPPVTPGSV